MTTRSTKTPPGAPPDRKRTDAPAEVSSIRSFLEGKTLLVTGTTGFLAKAIVEKILYEVPGVGRLYLLIRPKRRGGTGAAPMSPQERLEKEVLDSPAMGRIHEREGDRFGDFARAKVRAVAGDLSMPDLGFSDADRDRLVEEVDVVINSAATVVFDERVDQAIALNTNGPRRILEFAKSAKKRPVFVQISTCYVCGKRTGDVAEVVVETADGKDRPAPAPELDREIEQIEEEVRRVMAEAETDAARRRFRAAAERAAGATPSAAQVQAAKENDLRESLVAIGMRRARARGWNDTYTYTKAMGERMIMRERGTLPAVIVRPSIIESSLREPIPGWIDGYRMADPLIAAYGRGRLDAFPTRPEIGLDIIPLDLVVNAILAAIPRAAAGGGFTVYQVASSTRNCLTIRHMVELLTQHFTQKPMHDASGRAIAVKPFRFATPAQFRWRCLVSYTLPLRALRAITAPLAFLDAVARFRKGLEGKSAALSQLLYFSDIYGPYTTLDVRFATDNTRALLDSLSREDRDRFSFDETRIDWNHYIDEVHIPGLRRNVLQAEARRTGEWAGMEVVMEKVQAEEEAAAQAWEEPIAPADGQLAEAAPAPPHEEGIANIRDLIARTASRLPERTALQVQRDGEWVRYTYRELLERADELGRRLRARGVAVGDRVVLWCEGRPEWGLCYLAVTGTGAVAVPADPQLPEADFMNLFEVTKPALLLASDRCLERLSVEARRVVHQNAGISLIDSAFALDTGEPLPPPVAESEIDRAAVSGESLASIIFTSGTTVAPKGVMLTHGNFLANVRAVTSFTRLREDDAFLSVLPLHHVFEFTAGFLSPLSAGATVTYLAELSSVSIVGAMQQTGTTVMLGVPRLYSLLHDGIVAKVENAGGLDKSLFPVIRGVSRLALRASGGPGISKRLFGKVHRTFGGRIRMFVSGGAPLDPVVYEAFREMGFEVVEGYGLTETAPVLTMNPLGATRAASVGKPIPGVKLFISRPDASGVGEVVVSGGNVMRGYYERPEDSARVLTNGWLRTGDLGFLDADGYLFLTGRIKDLIVTAAGKNVYPDEVEAHYQGIPGVKDFTIIGVRPPGTIGEEVHAVVVAEQTAPGAAAEAETVVRDRIRAAFSVRAARLPSYQHVQAVHLWSGDLPKTSTLKVKRARVRDAILARLQGGGRGDGARAATSSSSGGAEERSECAGEVTAFLARLSSVPASEITPTKKLEIDLGVDSLMRVEIAAFLQSRFGAHLSDEEQLGLKTVGDILEIVERQAGRTAAPEAAEEPESTELVAYWERELARTQWGAEEGGEPPPSALHRVARVGILTLGRVAYGTLFRLRGVGTEHLPEERPYIVAANHASHLDSIAVLLAVGAKGKRLRVVGARDYFFNTKLKAWFFGSLLRTIPFDRHENFLAGLRLCKLALEANNSLLIFPEGTRSITGRLQPFKLGVGILAHELGVPIVPASIEGAYDALPKGASFPKARPVCVRFGPPIISPSRAESSDGSAYEAYKETVETVRAAIEAMQTRPS